VVAAVLWALNGFSPTPWASALACSVTIASTVLVAKGPQRTMNLYGCVVLMFSIDVLLWIGFARFGFVHAFLTWGIASILAIVVSSFMLSAAQGLLVSGGSDEDFADWVLSRGLVFGGAGFVATIGLAPA